MDFSTIIHQCPSEFSWYGEWLLKDKTISSSSHRGNNSSNCQCPVAGLSKKEKRSFFDMTIGELWWFWILIILILIGIIAYLVLRNRDREDEFKEKRVGF